jgi:IclR family acetate operon transcriptional repressor
LSMFKNYGFVEQDERSHAYMIGSELVTLSASIAAKSRIVARVRPVLNSLASDSDETVHLAMLSGASVIYMDCVESKKSERATPRTGRSMPAYATASGKAILAELSMPRIAALFPSESLPRVTPHTLKTRDALARDLKETRARGFALGENESQVGFFSFACPIRNAEIADGLAIVIAAPSRRFRKNRQTVADLLCRSAEVASNAT